MRELKKKCIIFLVIIYLCFCFLTACKPTANEGLTFTTESMEPEFLSEPTDEELSFYPTIEEALESSKMSKDSMYGTKKIVKVVEKNNRCDVFFINTKDGEDGLFVYKLKMKLNEKQTLYSESMYATGGYWNVVKWWIRALHKRCKDTELIKQVVLSHLHSYNSSGTFDLGESGGQVKWGLYTSEDIKSLTINGEAPTEIIELTMNGELVYFWYYENLDLPRSEITSANIEY